MSYKLRYILIEYSLSAITEGIDAIATTRVLIHGENSHMSSHALTRQAISRTFSGTGSEMDVVVSSIRAYVGALKKMLSFENRSEENTNAATKKEKQRKHSKFFRNLRFQ